MSIADLDLEMGIWSADDATVWLPKELFPTRSEAKMFAVEYLDHIYIEVRVRTRWMKYAPKDTFDIDYPFHAAEKGEDGAFECWEIT